MNKSIVTAVVLTGLACVLPQAQVFAQYVDGGTTGPLTWELTDTASNYTLTISGEGRYQIMIKRKKCHGMIIENQLLLL